MKKIVDYRLIEGASTSDVEAKVRQLLNLDFGWHPHGEVVVYCSGTTRGESTTYNAYLVVQALVKYEEQKEFLPSEMFSKNALIDFLEGK